MKVAIILLGFLAAVCLAEEGKVLFEKCPDFKLVYPELKPKIHLDNLLGPWRTIRKGPCADPTKFEKFDCMGELYWRDDKTPDNTVNFVVHLRNETEHKSCSGTVATKGMAGHEVENHFVQTMKHPEEDDKEVRSETVLIDTNDGESWSVWVSCIEFDPTNATVVWGIYSRYQWIDARIEQQLVERIEKYGGVAPAQLRGVGQTDCFKGHKH